MNFEEVLGVIIIVMVAVIITMFIVLGIGCSPVIEPLYEDCDVPFFNNTCSVPDVDYFSTHAVIDVTQLDLFVNENDEDEILIDYWVTNYGGVEAKNLMVDCFLLDDNYEVVVGGNESIGNVTSQSVEMKEMVMEVGSLDPEGYYSHMCFVSSCDNCEVLNQKIPSINSYHEDFKKASAALR